MGQSKIPEISGKKLRSVILHGMAAAGVMKPYLAVANHHYEKGYGSV
jgi:hypothetical protein